MEFTYSNRMNGLSGSATREILKLVARPDIISFAGGLPAKEGLPVDEIRAICDEVLSDPVTASTVLQYGTTEGMPILTEELQKFLATLGFKAERDEIQTLSGSQQGIDLAFKTFLNPNDVVLAENPTYLAMLQIAKTYEAQVVGVDADDNGLVISDLERKIREYKPKLLYVVPTFSNPTGKTYTKENRKAICELTAKYGVAVLEDDPYSRLRFDGEEVKPLKSFDTVGNVLYMTSFSKTVSPGLRVGAVYGNRELIRKLTVCKQGTDLHTGNMSQIIVAKYLQKGLLYPHVEAVLPVYRERLYKMLDCLDKHMPEEFVHTRPEGGLFIWGHFPEGINTVELLPRAIEEKHVAYIQGREFYADGGGLNTIRLNFSNASLENIERGVKGLGELFKTEISKLNGVK